MENNEILEGYNEDDQPIKERRGAFLLVLCVLSWVSLGLAFFSELYALIIGKSGLEKSIDAAYTSKDLFAENSFFGKFMNGNLEMLENQLENYTAMHASNILLILTGVLSVYLMFSLKKTGFYLYVIYALGSVAVLPIFTGTSFMVIFSVITGGVVSIAFIIMYATNLKRMTA